MAIAAATSDALVIVQEWISEHYFTSEAKSESFAARVLARRREWDGEERSTVREKLVSHRRELLRDFAALAGDDAAEVSALNDRVAEILGYHAPGRVRGSDGSLRLVRNAGLEKPVIALIDARPSDGIESLVDRDADTLTEPYAAEDGTELRSVSRLLSHLFVRDDARPDFALVLAGPKLLVAERQRWAEGRYLSVDLQLVLERNDNRRGGELDRALVCVAAESLAPDADGEIWWAQTLQESVRHTVGVSKELREGVRLSIEIIANEVVARRSAQNLDPLPAAAAQPLAAQALRFLYRVLFLLYAEASPQLGVLPVGAPEYERGYSLDRLRDLTLTQLTEPAARSGTHLYQSLAMLCKLVDAGHDPGVSSRSSSVSDGLAFHPLRADLFAPTATALIDEVGLGNLALQRVLRHLLVREGSTKENAGFISYAELGINQLGAVYEGLMSYTGFFAEEDLYEVAKDGNPEKGSWVAPMDRTGGIAEKDFVRASDPVSGEKIAIVHARGTFVFRLAGRERQQSASYYTPEVLTQFVVSQALGELLDQDEPVTSAAEVLELTVCEPALGSGAFAIEAVRQLAEEYLKRRQKELGETIEPDQYPAELQRVKAYLALHQVYGVDLNATAVELAEISLWLDTMVEGLDAPWFGLHLRRGNSLIGARRAVHSRAQAADRSWLKAVPMPVGDDENSVPEIAGRIPHFLMPAEGWGAAAGVEKSVGELVPEPVTALKKWRKDIRHKPSKTQIDALLDMGRRVQRLWEIAGRRLDIADGQIRRDIPMWGRSQMQSQPGVEDSERVVSREEIEAALADRDGAYQRLRRLMDAWCALWFWPLTETEIAPPTFEQWLEAATMLLGRHAHKRDRPANQVTLGESVGWDALGALEENDRIFAGAASTDVALQAHPWLAVCEQIAERQGFFHWELEFAPVFARGGFDLQLGNPPWVRPRSDIEGLLAEGDPWWRLANKPTQAQKAQRRPETLALPGIRELVIDGTAEMDVQSEFLGSTALFPHLAGLQPNLYRCFMEMTWSHRSRAGIVALIHPESHFTEDKAGLLRAATYRRLRRHWQFINELNLFEIQHQKWFGVHVYGDLREEPLFLNATTLYRPDVLTRSLLHDGSGAQPGLKDDEGDWDLRPHRDRILEVDLQTLRSWQALIGSEDTPVMQTRMVYVVNRVAASALESLADRPRMAALGFESSRGWDESIDRVKGRFEREWGPVASWDEVILQGPHIHVGRPFYKRPNEGMTSQLDWSFVDLERLTPTALPVTSYKPRGENAAYDGNYTQWGEAQDVPARDHYRIAWRRQADNVAERTLMPTIIPPGAAHIHGVSSVGRLESGHRDLVRVTGFLMSLISDFGIRAIPKGDIYASTPSRLAVAEKSSLISSALVLRVLRLNCLTSAYADLWRDALPDDLDDGWTGGLEYPGRPALADVTADWTPDSPLRRDADRRRGLVEIDALVALSLDLSIDQLCTIYRTQFPVLYGYDHGKYVYDANGRLLPSSVVAAWNSRGDALSVEERTDTNPSGYTYTYGLPFRRLDREDDMRVAYAEFAKRYSEVPVG